MKRPHHRPQTYGLNIDMMRQYYFCLPQPITMLRTISSKLPSYSNWKVWLLLALFLKSSIFVWKASQGLWENNIDYQGTFMEQGGDTFSYIDPIDNLINNGEYADDYRMPGYGAPYYILRAVLPPITALNAVGILQVLLASLSLYLLALLSRAVFRSDGMFYLVFLLFGVSTYSSLYDQSLLTESFSTSALIIASYLIICKELNFKWLLITGLLLTWCIFLKPVLAPVYGIFLLVLYLRTRQEWSFKSLALKGLLPMLIPLMLIDGAWIVRNYQKYEGFYPMQKSVIYEGFEDTYVSSVYNFVLAFGGSTVYWEPGAEATFFMKSGKRPPDAPIEVIPERAYTSVFNRDSLLHIQSDIVEIQTDSTSKERRWELIQSTMASLEKYTESIKEEKPMLFYLTSRVISAKRFLVHSGTYNLLPGATSDLSLINLGIKVFYSVFYLASIALGLLGMLLLAIQLLKKFEYAYLLLLLLAGYLVFFFPLVMKADEYRYLVNAYPFMVVLGCYSVWMANEFLGRFRSKRSVVE